MAKKITVDLSDDQMKALEFIALDPQEWINNLVQARAAAAMQEIYDGEVTRMINDPNVTTMPANRDQVIRNANLKSAKQRHQEAMANMPAAMPLAANTAIE